jgi:DNA-binding NarL/FixJ family response regulator
MINLAIVEDHRLFREGLKSLFSDIDDFEVKAEFSNGQDYINNIFNLHVDVVLMDIEMPVMNGIEATRLSKIKKPEIQIIALSMFSDQKYYYEMIKSGISGFVLKEASPEELEKAIRDVSNGLGFFSPKLLQQAIIHMPEIEKKRKAIDKLQLTEREIEIIDLVCQGYNNNKIADKLFLSPKTVESHKTHLLSKTGTKNSAELIIFAIKNELIEI